ncbi:MAG: DUF2442 domain-containing protein [Pseudonocardiaceae bacterium]
MELIIDVMGVRVLSRYILQLTFDTGEVKILDVVPLLNGPIFAELRRDYGLFGQVRVDDEAGTVVWPNGADLSPRTLYSRSRDSVPHAS